MKRITLPSLFIILALSISSCSVHLGLSKIFNSSSGSKNSSGSSVKQRKTAGTSLTPSVSSSPGSNTQAGGLSVSHGKGIIITSTGFQPYLLKVKRGRTVTWTNNDTLPQSVTSDQPGLFDSGLINPGGKYTFTFTGPGTFRYHSTSNSSLDGVVILR